MNTEREFLNQLTRWGAADAPLLVALSGGRDSLGLLALCLETHRSVAAVCHFNHGLRPESDDEEAALARLADQLGLPFFVGRPAGVYEGTGLAETWARRQRHRWFDVLLQRHPDAFLLTAHHRQDQALTVLSHLSRGTGPRGLAGIPPRRGRLLRPLLAVPRSELEAAARRQGWRWFDDPSNDDPRGARCRLASVFTEGFFEEDRLVRLAERTRQWADYFELRGRDLARCLSKPAERFFLRLPLKELRGCHDLEIEALFGGFARGLGWPGLLGARRDALLAVMRRRGNFLFDWGPGLVLASEGELLLGPSARRDGGGLVLTPQAPSGRWGGWQVSLEPWSEGALWLPVKGTSVRLARGSGERSDFFLPLVDGNRPFYRFPEGTVAYEPSPGVQCKAMSGISFRPLGPWEED